jgi:hypothetical protein
MIFLSFFIKFSPQFMLTRRHNDDGDDHDGDINATMTMMMMNFYFGHYWLQVAEYFCILYLIYSRLFILLELINNSDDVSRKINNDCHTITTVQQLVLCYPLLCLSSSRDRKWFSVLLTPLVIIILKKIKKMMIRNLIMNRPHQQ